MADRTALALLLLQQASRFGIEPQQEVGIGRHLGLQDQRGPFRPIGGRQKQASSLATTGWVSAGSLPRR